MRTGMRWRMGLDLIVADGGVWYSEWYSEWKQTNWCEITAERGIRRHEGIFLQGSWRRAK